MLFGWLLSGVNLVAQVDKPGLVVGGNVRVTTVLYGVNGIENRRAPFGIIASGSPYVEVFGNRVPLQFTLSNFRSNFHQPFNQFGISPQYKWIKLHLGFRNLQFSQFSLGGARLLGVGVELTPGRFYLGGAYGRFRAARTFGDGDLAIIPGMYTVGAVYERRGYAVKTGIGHQKHFFHLIFLNASDERSSLSPIEGRSLPPVQQNKAFGFISGFQLLPGLQWRVEGTLSAWTLDESSPFLQDVPNIVSFFYRPRESSQYLFAGETSLAYRIKGYMVEAKYRRIDPDYKSMGVYYIQSDLEQYSAQINLPIKQGRYFVGLGGGIQQDNLSGLKSATSRRVIANVNTTMRLTDWFMMVANYSNFGISQSPVQATISDTLLLEQVHKNLMVAPNFQFRSNQYTHGIQLQYMEQGLSDLRASTFGTPELSSRMYSIQYNLGVPKSRINSGISVQRMNSFLGLSRLVNSGMNLNFSRRLQQKGIQLSSQGGFYVNQLDGLSNGYTLRFQAGCDWPIFKNMRISLQGQWLKNNVLIEGPVRSFTEWTMRSTISYNFTSEKRKAS